MAEPPKLYGPHAHIIVLKTSDYCTREPDNSGSLSCIIGEPRIIHILQLIQDQHGVTTTLQYLLQKISYIGVRKTYNISLQNMFR